MKLNLNKESLIVKLILYMIRWQLSTPILAIVTSLVNNGDTLTVKSIIGSSLANLIGSLIFFWVDRKIFK